MAHSYRKSPVIAPKSNKLFKAKTQRALRHNVKQSLLSMADEAGLLQYVHHLRAISQKKIRCSAKRGRCSLFGETRANVTKLMRK